MGRGECRGDAEGLGDPAGKESPGEQRRRCSEDGIMLAA